MSTPFIQVCTLQEAAEDGCYTTVDAEALEVDGEVVLILTQPGYSNASLRLTREGWETLVTMFAHRYPPAALRIATKAQGWVTK